MQKAKDPKLTGTNAGGKGTEKSRDSDATSHDTLSDLEEKEQVSDTSDDRDSSTPSPDGSFDEGRSGGDAGLM